MRAAVLAAVLGIPLSASAAPRFHDIIKQPPRRAAPATPRAAGFTTVSHVIYLNPCLPNGCNVRPGFDDSRTDTSSIPTGPATLAAWPHGQQKWDALVQCVKDLYGPFDITVTDVDPGGAPHFEVMMAGHASAIGADGAGGIAPFLPCNGDLQDNVISFVFAAQTDNLDFMCWAAAQESAHVFGLDHELNALDPMTYLAPPIRKPAFQNADALCGEELGNPRECWCGGTTQNSYQYLMDTFGPANLEPASLSITEPADGAWVKPGFTVRAQATSQLSVRSGSLSVDGATTQQIDDRAPLVFGTPPSLAGGDHQIAVTVTDAANRTFGSSITVHVTASCANGERCASGFHCLGSYCLPGADVTGGLGATCTANEQCITGTCGSDGSAQRCTDACDDGTTCPAGFTCLPAGAGTACWPGDDGGGCATAPDGSWLALGLGLLGLLGRRRR